MNDQLPPVITTWQADHGSSLLDTDPPALPPAVSPEAVSARAVLRLSHMPEAGKGCLRIAVELSPSPAGTHVEVRQLAHLPLIADGHAEAVLLRTVEHALRDLGLTWDDL
jgi:hypothetical protein